MSALALPLGTAGCRALATQEPAWVRWTLIGLALAFLTLFLFVPLISVFYEALHGKQEAIFRDEIYVPVGTILVISTLVLCALYYYFLNGLRARFNTRGHWAATLLLNVLLNFAAVLWISSGLSDDANFGTAVLVLCLINALYAALAFTAASFAFKWLSPHARYTPA